MPTEINTLGNGKNINIMDRALTYIPTETNMLGSGKKMNIIHQTIYVSAMDKALTHMPTEINILGNGKMVYATGKECSHMLVEELKMVYGKEINYLNQNNKYKTKKAATTTTCIFMSQCVVLNPTLLVI